MFKFITGFRNIFSVIGMVILGFGPYLYVFLVIPGFVFLKGIKFKLEKQEAP